MAALPTADDLLFLLSIVSNPNRFIAENTVSQSGVQKTKASGDNDTQVGTSSSWQQTLTSFPAQRRHVILALQRLANARQKWNDLSSKAGGNEKEPNFAQEADVLEEVENSASAIRLCTAEYLQSIQDYKTSLHQFWVKSMTRESCSYSELSHVGRVLASQLLCQIQWDERLGHSILSFLDEELYAGGNNATEKLRVWADAMTKMMKICKSHWDFVEREVNDETVLGEEGELLNGEPSTQIIRLGPSTESAKNTAEISCENTDSIKGGSLHHRIVSSASVEEAVETFLHSEVCQAKREDDDGRVALGELQQGNESSITSILLVGDEGCGKSHLLDCIQRRAAETTFNNHSVKVLRPKYPVDLVGSSIGSSEDCLIALFTYVSRVISTTSENNGGSRCLILLDDIDKMLSLTGESPELESAGGNTQYYIGRRCKALFLTILDAFCKYWPSVEDGHILLLCTSRSQCGEVANRFDRTFRAGQPNEKQRRHIFTSCLSPGNVNVNKTSANDDDREIENILSLVVKHSAGRSASELSLCCRDAILRCAKSTILNEDSAFIFMRRLQHLDKMLQAKSPQSLRSGSLDGIVDMRVFTPEELQSKLTTNANGEVIMPLLGADAKRAHDALMNVLVTPLCRSDEIRALLYGGSGHYEDAAVDAKPIRVGALLAGPPGVGKTELAYYCASLAAKMSSRVSLLDVSCTSLIHKEIGGSERAVHRLFAAVRAAAPCILLLDGIENVAARRGNDNTTEGTFDRVLSTFLTEMDGIESGGDGTAGNVAVIGVTHYPHLIDPSLLRPGRLEKTITLGAPDLLTRKEIIMQQIKDTNLDFASAGYFDPKSKDELAQYIATECAGMSAVEVIATCEEASMECLRELDFVTAGVPDLSVEHFKRAMRKGTKTTS